MIRAPIPPLLLVLLAAAACRSAPVPRTGGALQYQGSSTVAVFLRAAEAAYGAIDFDIDTAPESEGGEAAIVAGRTDLAGIARDPDPATLAAGVEAALIGRDAIAVIVNEKNPRTNLTLPELRSIFTGRIEGWRELGGPDLPLTACIVGEESATREVFRAAVLGQGDYAGCRVVRPDEAIIRAVAGDPGAIGTISFSFLEDADGVRAISVDGQKPSVTNFEYPIARPLHLLWREGSPVVREFIDWTQSAEGQRIVMRDFVGVRVAGSVGIRSEGEPTGTLIVYTETYPVYDGGIYYYPHSPYEIFDRDGKLVGRVSNHRGQNDERAMRVELGPGTYLIRTTAGRVGPVEFFVTVERDRVTELDVPELLRSQR